MGIDVYQTQAQARKISSFANDLTSVRNILQLYENRLRQHWDSTEMASIITGLDKLIRSIDTVSGQITSLSNNIISTATQVKREEDLAAARAVLSQASSRYSLAKQNYIRLQNIYYNNPSESVERSMIEARNKYYAALSQYNAASAKVKSLS